MACRRLGRGSERGASAVEFALVLPILVLFLLGMMQFGIVFAANQGLEAAAREGGRLAAVGRDVKSGDVVGVVQGAAVPFVRSTAIDVDPGDECPSSVDDFPSANVNIIVTASVDGSAYGVELLRFIGISNPDLSARAVFRCEAAHDAY